MFDTKSGRARTPKLTTTLLHLLKLSNNKAELFGNFILLLIPVFSMSREIYGLTIPHSEAMNSSHFDFKGQGFSTKGPLITQILESPEI